MIVSLFPAYIAGLSFILNLSGDNIYQYPSNYLFRNGIPITSGKVLCISSPFKNVVAYLCQEYQP